MFKNFFASNTIRGILVVVFAQLLPTLGPFIGLSFTAADGQELIGAVDEIIMAGGVIWATYGRVVAKGPLNFKINDG